MSPGSDNVGARRVARDRPTGLGAANAATAAHSSTALRIQATTMIYPQHCPKIQERRGPECGIGVVSARDGPRERRFDRRGAFPRGRPGSSRARAMRGAVGPPLESPGSPTGSVAKRPRAPRRFPSTRELATMPPLAHNGRDLAPHRVGDEAAVSESIRRRHAVKRPRSSGAGRQGSRSPVP